MSTSSFARAAALVAGLAFPLIAGVPAGAADANPCNPCAPTETNPCGAKNPCNPCGAEPGNPCNPCAGGPANPCNPCNPCGAKGANPCGARNPCNPCGSKGTNPCNPCGASGRVDPAKFTRTVGLRMGGDRSRLVAEGEELWNDTGLSTNGAACATCHASYGQFLPTFAEPYPHEVKMVKSLSGVEEVGAAEMVQFCMLQPMEAEPLPWSSHGLAALTAYVEHLQSGFEPNPCAMKSANPCNPCNPCGAKVTNPCGANPCSR